VKFAANLTLLYGHLPLLERFAAAARDGFTAVEILFPYDQTPQWYANRLDEAGLQLVLINTPITPEYPWGMAGQAGAQAEFHRGWTQALDVCAATGCRVVHVMAGGLDSRSEAEQQQRLVLVQNLAWAAAQDRSITLTLEALNRFDVPGYFYAEPREVLSLLQELDEPNAGLQFDFYHVVMQGLDVMATLVPCMPTIRHVQVAGSPGRHEPDLQQHALLEGLRHLAKFGYAGYLGFEYRPRANVTDGLVWAHPLLAMRS
jgi:hydroxypyruvate isomerase